MALLSLTQQKPLLRASAVGPHSSWWVSVDRNTLSLSKPQKAEAPIPAQLERQSGLIYQNLCAVQSSRTESVRPSGTGTPCFLTVESKAKPGLAGGLSRSPNPSLRPLISTSSPCSTMHVHTHQTLVGWWPEAGGADSTHSHAVLCELCTPTLCQAADALTFPATRLSPKPQTGSYVAQAGCVLSI